ncbi:hypothetical protein GCM10007423_64070 [Dyadobacter endophyticus]|uniref:Uncharacterized protein n=1 Tax=Dyadobacter endophyticus TaxID=1749036 RepID=A0ABQ1ZB03_9BACT|nr:hypothetical protein [Dyadobacter endophyticus]GGH55964.1 hypothetical protein GCM10007423_64070 [Dyadobacter endophyticus]
MEPLKIQSKGDTQFQVELHKNGLWSETPEICIAHVLRGKRSNPNPSIPISEIPQLIEYIAKAYQEALNFDTEG